VQSGAIISRVRKLAMKSLNWSSRTWRLYKEGICRNEKQIKSIVSIATPDLSAYTKSLEEVSLVARSMPKALRLSLENSGFRPCLKACRQHDGIARAAFGQLEELRRAGLFFTGQREMDVAR
jgi:hypothetical protein